MGTSRYSKDSPSQSVSCSYAGCSVPGGLVKEIPLTQGKVALVDDEDFEWLAQFKWCLSRTSTTEYALRRVGRRGSRHGVFMHRAILGTPPGTVTDHANGNGLDNRRSNLRICSQSQNGGNSAKWRTPCSSQYKGVYLGSGGRSWRAHAMLHGRTVHLGSFASEREAAQAYNAWAVKTWGEFARVNDLSK